MNISYNWLKNYLKTDLTVSEITPILNSIGLEVEAVEEIEEIKGSLRGVVIGEVLRCEKHPDADKLKITEVNIGGAESLQIICGAPNVAVGQKVFVATIGTQLHFSNGEEIKIKRSKIRGVESFGMICAEDELGIGESHDGIMILDSRATIGQSASDYLSLEMDTLLQIGLTPNRIDAASHIGVAIDLCAYLSHNNIKCKIERPSISDFDNLTVGLKRSPVTIEIADISGAPRYAGISLGNVTVTSSPKWLQNKLIAIGLKPINSVVDITNFVLHETGQPLHAFDRSMIEGNQIIVRRASEGEVFTTLDNVERRLSKEDLMICNRVKPMCIAGIFGGLESGVSSSTTSIFIESAYFNPVSIRKSAKRHGLNTDASFRYERGANPDMVIYALKRAAILICELTGAVIDGGIEEIYPEPIRRAEIALSFKRIQNLIGKEIEPCIILNILKFLEFEILESDLEGAIVMAPLYRVDVTRECDVAEEILRIYGYNNIEFPERVRTSISVSPKPDPERIIEVISSMLVSNGFYEIMNNSFTKSANYEDLTTFPEESLVRPVNPLSSDLNAMRQTLLFGGLETISHNINRKRNSLKLFEVGTVYSLLKDGAPLDLSSYLECKKISLLITGGAKQEWTKSGKESSYFMMKGFLELLLGRFGISLNGLEYINAPSDIFEEGLSYSLSGGESLAIIGSITPKLLKKFDIKQSVYAAEISFPLLMRQIAKRAVRYSELPKFPEVKRDLALIVDEQISFVEILNLAYKTERKLLKSLSLFDVYRGDKIAENKKQLVISFILRDDDKTMNDKAVEEVMEKLLKVFADKFGASLK